GRQRIGEPARVVADQAGVELLGLQMAHEGIALQRQANAELLADIEDPELEPWVEEVPTGEVERTVALQLAQRQGPGLLNAVVYILNRQGRVSASLAIAEFSEGSAKPHCGRIPPAIFPGIRPRGVVVNRSLGAANLRPVFLEAEASPRELGHNLEGRASTSRQAVPAAPQRA